MDSGSDRVNKFDGVLKEKNEGVPLLFTIIDISERIGQESTKDVYF